uniref:Putative serine/arginine repetitive matrix protein 1 n=1 Tax=Ixodes ricinus TaxID=34613 RepID=V5HY64_IXORI
MNSPLVTDPEEEMRLLKDRVRQLELQNKQLRKNQRSPVDTTSSKERKQSRNMSMSDNDKSSKESSLEDLGIIDVDRLLENDDDETWLCDPSERPWPIADASEAKELVNTRISLASKLDEISQLASRAQELRDMLARVRHPGPSRTFDSRTFTRPRRKLRPALDWNALPTISAAENGAPAADHDTPRGVSPVREAPPPVAPPPEAAAVPLASVNVHEIVRLQGESLRLSSPMCSPKRGSGESGGRRSSAADKAPPTSGLPTGCTTGARPSDPRREDSPSDGDGLSRVPLDGGARAATPPTPDLGGSAASSPYGSNSSLHHVSLLPSKGATRRSLPNLSRVLNGLGSHPGSAVTGQQATLGAPRSRLAVPTQHEVPGRSALPAPRPTRSRSSSVASTGLPAASPLPRGGRRSEQFPPRPEQTETTPLRLSLAPRNTTPATQPRSGLPRPSRIPPPTKRF